MPIPYRSTYDGDGDGKPTGLLLLLNRSFLFGRQWTSTRGSACDLFTVALMVFCFLEGFFSGGAFGVQDIKNGGHVLYIYTEAPKPGALRRKVPSQKISIILVLMSHYSYSAERRTQKIEV